MTFRIYSKCVYIYISVFFSVYIYLFIYGFLYKIILFFMRTTLEISVDLMCLSSVLLYIHLFFYLLLHLNYV